MKGGRSEDVKVKGASIGIIYERNNYNIYVLTE